MPPLSDRKSDQDAHWSPKPRKSCVTATTRHLFLPWDTCLTALEAPQVAQRRQGGGRVIALVAQRLPWSPNGCKVVATAIAQWTLLVGQWRHHGGTKEAEASLRLKYNVYNRKHSFMERPLCIHSATTAMCVPLSFERPVDNEPLQRPLCDCFEHA